MSSLPWLHLQYNVRHRLFWKKLGRYHDIRKKIVYQNTINEDFARQGSKCNGLAYVQPNWNLVNLGPSLFGIHGYCNQLPWWDYLRYRYTNTWYRIYSVSILCRKKWKKTSLRLIQGWSKLQPHHYYFHLFRWEPPFFWGLSWRRCDA